MKHLNEVVDVQNVIATAHGNPLIDISKIDQCVADKIYGILDTNMSVEVLTCNGERSRAQVRKLYNLYINAARELHNLGFTPSNQLLNIKGIL